MAKSFQDEARNMAQAKFHGQVEPNNSVLLPDVNFSDDAEVGSLKAALAASTIRIHDLEERIKCLTMEFQMQEAVLNKLRFDHRDLERDQAQREAAFFKTEKEKLERQVKAQQRHALKDREFIETQSLQYLQVRDELEKKAAKLEECERQLQENALLIENVQRNQREHSEKRFEDFHLQQQVAMQEELLSSDRPDIKMNTSVKKRPSLQIWTTQPPIALSMKAVRESVSAHSLSPIPGDVQAIQSMQLSADEYRRQYDNFSKETFNFTERARVIIPATAMTHDAHIITFELGQFVKVFPNHTDLWPTVPEGAIASYVLLPRRVLVLVCECPLGLPYGIMIRLHKVVETQGREDIRMLPVETGRQYHLAHILPLPHVNAPWVWCARSSEGVKGLLRHIDICDHTEFLKSPYPNSPIKPNQHQQQCICVEKKPFTGSAFIPPRLEVETNGFNPIGGQTVAVAHYTKDGSKACIRVLVNGNMAQVSVSALRMIREPLGTQVPEEIIPYNDYLMQLTPRLVEDDMEGNLEDDCLPITPRARWQAKHGGEAQLQFDPIHSANSSEFTAGRTSLTDQIRRPFEISCLLCLDDRRYIRVGDWEVLPEPYRLLTTPNFVRKARYGRLRSYSMKALLRPVADSTARRELDPIMAKVSSLVPRRRSFAALRYQEQYPRRLVYRKMNGVTHWTSTFKDEKVYRSQPPFKDDDFYYDVNAYDALKALHLEAANNDFCQNNANAARHSKLKLTIPNIPLCQKHQNAAKMLRGQGRHQESRVNLLDIERTLLQILKYEAEGNSALACRLFYALQEQEKWLAVCKIRQNTVGDGPGFELRGDDYVHVKEVLGDAYSGEVDVSVDKIWNNRTAKFFSVGSEAILTPRHLDISQAKFLIAVMEQDCAFADGIYAKGTSVLLIGPHPQRENLYRIFGPDRKLRSVTAIQFSLVEEPQQWLTILEVFGIHSYQGAALSQSAADGAMEQIRSRVSIDSTQSPPAQDFVSESRVCNVQDDGSLIPAAIVSMPPHLWHWLYDVDQNTESAETELQLTLGDGIEGSCTGEGTFIIDLRPENWDRRYAELWPARKYSDKTETGLIMTTRIRKGPYLRVLHLKYPVEGTRTVVIVAADISDEGQYCILPNDHFKRIWVRLENSHVVLEESITLYELLDRHYITEDEFEDVVRHKPILCALTSTDERRYRESEYGLCADSSNELESGRKISSSGMPLSTGDNDILSLPEGSSILSESDDEDQTGGIHVAQSRWSLEATSLSTTGHRHRVLLPSSATILTQDGMRYDTSTVSPRTVAEDETCHGEQETTPRGRAYHDKFTQTAVIVTAQHDVQIPPTAALDSILNDFTISNPLPRPREDVDSSSWTHGAKLGDAIAAQAPSIAPKSNTEDDQIATRSQHQRSPRLDAQTVNIDHNQIEDGSSKDSSQQKDAVIGESIESVSSNSSTQNFSHLQTRLVSQPKHDKLGTFVLSATSLTSVMACTDTLLFILWLLLFITTFKRWRAWTGANAVRNAQEAVLQETWGAGLSVGLLEKWRFEALKGLG